MKIFPKREEEPKEKYNLKLIEENVGENLSDLELGKDFLNETHEVQSIK